MKRKKLILCLHRLTEQGVHICEHRVPVALLYTAYEIKLHSFISLIEHLLVHFRREPMIIFKKYSDQRQEQHPRPNPNLVERKPCTRKRLLFAYLFSEVTLQLFSLNMWHRRAYYIEGLCIGRKVPAGVVVHCFSKLTNICNTFTTSHHLKHLPACHSICCVKL